MDAYFNLPIFYVMENIITKEVMEKLDIFQSRFGKVDKCGWWDLKRIQTDAGTLFKSKDSFGDIYVHRVRITLAGLDHQEYND